MTVPPRVIAFYLPQYHPIPQNDAWWGRGFTEWTNVAAATPRFPGHDQPRLPTELGFYDLRLSEAREAQASLARAHGIHGFCYYHYWFNGTRLLSEPLDRMLALGTPDFPFCLCWANENWTRTWDGHDDQILIAQRHGSEDDRAHIAWLSAVMRDPRYIRIDGRPLLIVYRPSKLPDAFRTASIWREEAHRLGVGDLYLAMVHSLSGDRLDPARAGFDAAIEFQPDWLSLGPPSKEGQGCTVYDYRRLVDASLAAPAPPFLRWPCVSTGWDNTPRRRTGATVVAGATPALYQQWLQESLARAREQGGSPLVFVNAWNEWGEGACLEPCRTHGRSYLEATAAAVAAASASHPPRAPAIQRAARARELTVAIPTFNGGRFLEASIRSVLAQTDVDLDVVVVDDASTDESAEVAQSFDDRRLTVVVNRRRLGLVGNWNKCLDLSRGEYVCVFHQDDVMDPGNLAAKARVLRAFPSAGFVHSNVRQIGPDDEVLSNWWVSEPTRADEGLHAGAGYFRRLFLGPNLVSCPSVVLRRSALDVVGGFDPAFPFTADWEMWLRLALHGDVGYLGAPLVRYRRHNGNETNAFAGVKAIEHEFRAKRAVAMHYRDRIDGVDELVAALTRRCRDLAIEEAMSSLLPGTPVNIQAVTLAIETHSYLSTSVAEHADWLGRMFELVVARGSVGREAPRSESAAVELERLRQLFRSPRYRVANTVANAIQRTPILWPLVRAATEGVLRVEGALRSIHRRR